jgi:hypothetical protein
VRGAKAKAMRRIAERQATKAGLPDIDYRAKPRIVEVLDPETNKLVKITRYQCVLGPCARHFYNLAKRKLARAPLVGAVRAYRRMMVEGMKNMEIVPLDAPPNLEAA